MKTKFAIPILFGLSLNLTAQNQQQNQTDLGTISGNVQMIAQYYQKDTLIDAALPDQKLGMNSFSYVNYSRGNFRAGIRYESYLNPLAGYPINYHGTGLGYRYVNWKNDDLEVTIGNFYEQFGSGLILRAYESRNLGIDNAFDGISLKYTPYKGIYLKGLVAKQRYNFSDGLINGNGLVRGFDGEININELLDSSLKDSKFRATIGGSFVSKFNNDNKTPDFILPMNVAAYGGRISLRYDKLRFYGEYIYKENDPYPYPLDDRFNYIYKNGQGILLNLGYSKKGLGIDLRAKYNDNMLWRSTNVSTPPTSLLIGYIPTLTKQHTYTLASTLYPYATNNLGEVAFSVDVIYTIPKKTLLGGKYGTNINFNAATAYVPNRQYINDMDSHRKSYKTTPFSIEKKSNLTHYKVNPILSKDSVLIQDINCEIKHKFNKKWKGSVSYFNFIFNDNAVKVAQEHVMIYAQIAVIDVTYKFNHKNAVRIEAQHLWTKQDRGNWAFGQIEYTYSPHWFVAILDQYNYANPNPKMQLHYPLATAGYIKGPHRFSLQYGKQRAGWFCVGGVCRAVPASYGFTFTVTSSF